MYTHFKKNKILVISLGILTILFSIFFLNSIRIYKEASPLPNTVPSSTNYKIEQEKIQKIGKATLEVSGVNYESEIVENINVYEFMEKLQKEGKINFKSKTYSAMGKLIEEINGIRNSGEKNWIYYVNNKKATIGVSNYKINTGDIVSWKYEKDI